MGILERNAGSETGLAAVMNAYREPLEVEEFPLPDVEPGALLTKIDVATICGSDVHIWENDLVFDVPLPLVMGHEMVGTVVTTGAAADRDSMGTQLRAGDRVVWSPASCRQCPTCNIDRRPELCPNKLNYGNMGGGEPPHFLGGFAEYAYVPSKFGRIRVRDDVKSEWASAASCALRTVVNAMRVVGTVDYVDSVVVQGAGPLGLFAAAVLSIHSPRHLIVVGAPDDRLELAREWGATHTISIEEYPEVEARREAIHTITGRGGPNIGLELSGAYGAAAEGIEMMRADGRYVIAGTLGGGKQSVDLARIATRGLHITGSLSADHDSYWKALEFIGEFRDRFDWDRMLGRRYGLGEVTRALESMKRMEDIKPIIDPSL